jgi:hypothetical protein
MDCQNLRSRSISVVLTVCMGISFVLASGLCGATAPEAQAKFETQLSSRDRGLLAGIACEAPAADQFHAWTDKRGSSRVAVTVRCKPHAVQQTLPVARYVDCSNARGTWTCGAGLDALLMTLPDASVLAVVPGAVPPRTAIAVVRQAMQLSIPPFHASSLPLLKDRCNVSQREAVEFKGATHFQLECTPGVMQLTRDCWKDKCRYFIVGGHRTN